MKLLRPALALVAILSLLGAAGCTRLKVESNPPGAKVLWSADGVTNWQPWPPPAWRATASGTEPITPMRAAGTFGDAVFITVEKEGYLRPLPQPAELYFWRGEHLAFDLLENPQTRSQRMRAQGLLLYKGNWVDPDKYDLVELEGGEVLPRAEATRREMTAKGLVEYNGEWLTPADAEARLIADKASAGLLPLKGRWVTATQRDAELAIDAEVAAIAAGKVYPDLNTPRITSAPVRDSALLQFSNSTGQVVRLLVSGPISFEASVDPYGSFGSRERDGITLPEGSYQLAVIPTGRDAVGRDLTELLQRLDRRAALTLSTEPVWSRWPFVKGQQYSFNFTGASDALQDRFGSGTTPTPEFEINAPTIIVPDIEIPRRVPANGGFPQGGENPGGGGGGRRGGGGGGGGGPR